MKRFFFIIISVLMLAVSASAAADWKLYPSFDANTVSVIDTPSRVYVISYARPYDATRPGYTTRNIFLFYYDKEADEYIGMTRQQGLSENVAQNVEYNPDKGYLLVVYSNYNIDLVYDDGRIVNIPGYMTSSVAGDKTVNSITFDPSANRAYLATRFGYVEINDAKGEIATSRVYGESIQGMARLGNYIVFLKDGALYRGMYSDPNFSIDDLTKVCDIEDADIILPLAKDLIAVRQARSSTYYTIRLVGLNDGEIVYNDGRLPANRGWYAPNKDGYLLGHPTGFLQLKKTGSMSVEARSEDDNFTVAGTWDGSEYWFLKERVGLYSRKSNGQNGFVTTRQPMLPNAPAPFICRDMVYHPRYGMLVENEGFTYDTPYNGLFVPLLLSGLKGGMWSQLSPAYRNTEQTNVMMDPLGIAIDPDNDKYVYMGSLPRGLVRLNLDDPQDILHMSQVNDPTNKLPGFVSVAETQTAYSATCKLSAPKFDSQGNLWTAFNNLNNDSKLELWYWPAASRKASVSADTFRPFGKIVVDGQKGGNFEQVYPLVVGNNKNLLIYTSDNYNASIVIYDHNGTPETTSDDSMAVMTNLHNQDGSTVDKNHIKDVYEDPQTGLVWVCTTSGVFYFEPRQAMKNPSVVTTPKVARNDGSGFADYLLNGVDVMQIAVDGAGRKWFATKGAGLVCTAGDGRSIVSIYTTENSMLPDDNVMSVAYNPSAGSIMVGTLSGFAELFPSGTMSAPSLDEVRAYPNPVRPDYYGYVTIDGLTDNAVVKIVDASGNLVKELGLAENGTCQWDATNFNFRRVPTGVYYVLASSGPNDASMAKVAKILVMN